ncbi:MAG: hypothetical protein AVDCRST_MAG93-8037, partial [uncultured Chloroflexia bacterium]
MCWARVHQPITILRWPSHQGQRVTGGQIIGERGECVRTDGVQVVPDSWCRHLGRPQDLWLGSLSRCAAWWEWMKRASGSDLPVASAVSQEMLNGIVRSMFLLVIVTGVLLHGMGRTDITGPTRASSSASLAVVTAPQPAIASPAPSIPAGPVVAPPQPVSRGGDNRHVPVPEAPKLSAAELATIKPNELGHVPVLMYHAFTTNPEYLDEWTITPERFREHLQWLADHGFFIISLAELISNEIAVPAGKHPVVLTFDDASSGQFRLLKDETTGQLAPDPTTAVGVMEAFFAARPEIGRGGHFAFVPNNGFH